MNRDWRDVGIKAMRSSGDEKTLCPMCSQARRNHREKCLSINHERRIWNCHHCGWSGALDGGDARQWRRPERVYVRPDYKPSEESPSEKLLAWFAGRGIPAEIVRRHRIESRQVFMPQLSRETRVIAFPYFRDAQLVNVKYRTSDKEFRMETGAELTLYGLDDIDLEQPLVFVEGEIDKLSVEVAGFASCVSVPNGAGTNLDVLASAERWLESVKAIVIAGDNDTPGIVLQNELVRRLGPERCLRAEWPEGCKDANDVLVKYGAALLRERIEQARPVPIEGAFEVRDIMPDLITLYENGRPRGEHPGWDNLNELYRPRVGEWTVVTGIPGIGKSVFVAAHTVNLALRSDWQFLVYPPENLPPEEYVSSLLEIYTGEPFNLGPKPRMSMDTMLAASAWVQEHFVVMNPTEGERNLDGLLKIAKSYIYRRGINGLVIDPWNELEHYHAPGQTMTQYIGESLIKIRQFARTHRIHIWVVAHPTKMHKNEDGGYPVVTLYDIADSAHWYNKADMGLSIWRDKTIEDSPVEIHVQKVRFRWCGHLGMAQLYYDQVTGRYSEHPNRYDLPPRYERAETDDDMREM